MKRIFVAEPALEGNERAYVLECLDTNWISSNGSFITRFEDRFAEFVGTRHAIATNNGTTALHLALTALGIGPGDEVIVPTVTYIASANAVRYCGATPVLVDVEPGTLLLRPDAVEERIGPRTRAIMPVHLYGHPADMAAIAEIAARNDVSVVEDAAEAHGAEVAGRRVGSLGTCGVFSFFGNKIITTGEGGMVTTDDDDLAERLRLFRGQGMNPNRRYWFEVVGYNYRMTNIQAALGLAQMERIDEILAARDEIGRRYDAALESLGNRLVRPSNASWARAVHWMYTVYLRDGDERERDRVMAALDTMGVETRPVFYPLHQMPPYRDSANPFPVADDWAARGMNLPTHLNLASADIERVANSLAAALVQ